MSTTDFVIKTSINSENYFCSKLINNSNESIEGFMFCFSVLAPVKIIDNCALHFSSGGYVELKPNAGFVLKPGDEWSFKFAYEESRHKPMNYRWSPQGCFLKTENEEILNLNVIDLDLERISSVAPIPHISGDKLNYESLRLVPHPYSWTASAGVCNLCPPVNVFFDGNSICLLYTSPSPRDGLLSRMPSSA